MQRVISLSDEDLAKLKGLLAQDKLRIKNAANRLVDEQIPQSPDTYICKTPAGGIPAMSGITPGSATCSIYRRLSGSLAEIGLTKTVYNFQSTAISGDTWIEVSRDKFGQWWPQASGGGGALYPGSGDDIHGYVHGGSTPYEVYYPSGLLSTSGFTMSATSFSIFPMLIPNDTEIDKLLMWLYSNASTVKEAKIVIYKAKSSLNPWPGSLVYQTGAISLPIVSAPGQWVYEDVSPTITLHGGVLYYMGVQANGAAKSTSAPVGGIWGLAQYPFGSVSAGLQRNNTYGSFPDPFPDYAASAGFNNTFGAFFHKVG